MKPPAFEILKAIYEKREMTLTEVLGLVPRKFGNHKDLYPLATLFTERYIDTNHDLKRNDSDYLRSNRHVARMLYTMTFGAGTFDYDSVQTTNDIDFKDPKEGLKFFSTAKTDIYFAEASAKRRERIVTILIACCIAIFSVLVTEYGKALLHKLQPEFFGVPTSLGLNPKRHIMLTMPQPTSLKPFMVEKNLTSPTLEIICQARRST